MIDTSVFKDKKVAFCTLGCKLNFAETSYIGKTLIEHGFRKAKRGEQADVCIINTCTVTEVADKKCRQAISKMHKSHPNAFIIVTGCYAQLKPDELAKISGVNLLLGANEKFNIIEHLSNLDNQTDCQIFHTKISQLKRFQPSCSQDDRTRHFLKVQDGCDYFCTYCTTPFARGRNRNASIAETVCEARKAIENGAREIVITGVNIGAFGKSTGENFFQLIKELDNTAADVRYRISSIEPDLLTDEIIDFVAQSNHFAPHFHIPLQSGSDEVLKLMKRRYDSALFAHKVHRIKQAMPDAFIGVDIIVGMRGETAALFDESRRFVEQLPISQLHVFTYSERPNTKALEITHKVSDKDKKLRSETLHSLSETKTKAFYESQRGKMVKVLWEATEREGKMFGFSENYVKVQTAFDKAKINTITTETLTEIEYNDGEFTFNKIE